MNAVANLFGRILKYRFADKPIAWIGQDIRPFILLGVALITAINFLSYDNIRLEGDGIEYFLTSEAFARHYSPALTAGDIQDAEARLAPYGQQLNPQVNVNALNQGEPNLGWNFYKSKYGSYFSVHFWLYPLVNAPCLLLTHILRLSPVKSFFILNSLIALSTITFISYAHGIDPLRKCCLILFYITSGTTYYLHWSHPEVFSASLLLISLILIEQGAYVPASFLLALSAQQNPPIGLIAAFSLSLGFYFDVIKGRERGRQALYGALLVLAATILFLSPSFYYINYGTLNMVGKIATDTQYISILRLESFYFDPNQGMIRAIPFIFLLTPIVYLLNCLNRRWSVIRSATLLIIMSIAMAIPSLSTTNWNAGCQVVMRYAYWAAMPIGFAFALLVVALPGKLKWFFFIIMATGQVLWVLQYQVDGSPVKNWNYSKATEWLLNNHAQYYNPPFPILITRGIHSEYYRTPVYYYVFENRVTKIAYRKDAENTVMPWSLSIAATKNLPGCSTVENEGGWFYINPRNVIRADRANGLHSWGGMVAGYHGELLSFGTNDNGVQYLGDGWSIPEEWGLNSGKWGIWSKSRESELFFAYDDIGNIPLLLKVTGNPFVNDKCPEQDIDVFVNNHFVSTISYHSSETQTTSVPVASDIINDSKIIAIRFDMKHAFRPIELPSSDDPRQLGIFLMGLQLCPDPKYVLPRLEKK